MIRLFKELLYPRRCVVCDDAAPFGKMICPECDGYLTYIAGARCVRCSKKLMENEQELCSDCKRIKHLYTSGIALYEYSPVSRSIYRFKYGGRQEYADYFSQQMASQLGRTILSWNPDYMIPVPLHKSKLVERGFNQSALLAKKLSDILKIPYSEKMIIRRRKTTPMKELTSRERQINLKNAFIMGDFDVKLCTIVIIDDIYTTGSTIDSMTEVLLSHGASKVYFVALSIGRGM